jgi:thiol-disulfide isomerase/thioredoxin
MVTQLTSRAVVPVPTRHNRDVAINLRLIVWLAVVAMSLAACGSQTSSAAGADQLRFTAKTLDGQEFHGSDLLGKAAVLWFWAPWCPACQSEAPMVGEVAGAHPAVTFVGVAGLDQVSAMRQFVDKYPVKSLIQLADTDGAVWKKFGVTHQPAFAFIHPDGSSDVVKGGMSQSDLTRRVTALSSSR